MKDPKKIFTEERSYLITVLDENNDALYQEEAKVSAKDAYVVISDMILDGKIVGAKAIVMRQTNANCGFIVHVEMIGLDIEGEICWMFNDKPYFVGKTMSIF